MTKRLPALILWAICSALFCMVGLGNRVANLGAGGGSVPIALDVGTAADTAGVWNSAYATTDTLTWAHTCTGSNLLLLVSIHASSGDSVAGVTYNGVAMTVAWDLAGSSVRNTCYYLVAPASGTHDVVVTFGASTAYPIAGSVSFTGVNQAGGASTFTAATPAEAYGSDVSTSVSSATGELAVAFYCGDEGVTPVAGQTSVFDAQLFSGRCKGSTKAGATSVTLTYTGVGGWATIGAIALKPQNP